MAVNAYSGPLITFGQGSRSDYNPDNPAPSMFAYGIGLTDTRAPFVFQPGQASTASFYGYAGGVMTLLDQAPSALATANVAALAALTAATPMTLVAVTGAGITVGASVTNVVTGQLVTGLLAVDGPMVPITPSLQASGMSLWNPANAISRCLTLTSAANLSALTITVNGYDVYGYPVTCTRAGPSGGTVTLPKAMKYVASVVPSASNAGTMSVGTSDTFGIPLRTDAIGYLTIYWNDTLISAPAGFTAAVTTDPSTALLGDVRGTYAVQTVADGTKRLQIFWRPKVANLSQTGIWGVTQV